MVFNTKEFKTGWVAHLLQDKDPSGGALITDLVVARHPNVVHTRAVLKGNQQRKNVLLMSPRKKIGATNDTKSDKKRI